MKHATDPCAQSALVARGPSTDRAIVRSRTIRRGESSVSSFALARAPLAYRRPTWKHHVLGVLALVAICFVWYGIPYIVEGGAR